jgi:TonB dependent receptor
MKYGDLHGDRRHLLKVYGSYALPWKATTGAYAVYQSGQPWEAWDYTKYSQYPDNSSSETIKFAEPAGSRKTAAHYQLDLDYTQNIPLHGLNLQLVGDVFNLFNKQTGYYYQPAVHSALFGQPLRYWAPRRFQLAARVQF